MKREFGKRFIELLFPTVQPTHGLVSAAEMAATTSRNGSAEPLFLGQRAFENVLARKQA